MQITEPTTTDELPITDVSKTSPGLVVPQLKSNYVFFVYLLIESFIGWHITLFVNLMKKTFPRRMKSLIIHLESFINRPMARNTITLLFVNGIMGVLAIGTQVLSANMLGKARLSDLATYSAIGTCGALVVRFGRERTMVRDLVQFPMRFNQIVGTTVILSLLLMILFVSGLIVFGTQTGLVFSLPLWIVVFGVMILSFDLQPVYDSWRLMGVHVTYSLFRRCVECVPLWLIAMVYPSFYSVALIGLLMLIAVIMNLIQQYRQIKTATGLVVFTRDNFYNIGRQFCNNLPIAFGTCLLMFYGPAIQLFLRKSHEDVAGVFAAAIQVLLIVNFIFMQVARIGRPAMAQVTIPGISVKKRKSALQKYVFVMLVSVLPLALPMILFPHWIVSTLFKPEYAAAASILPILGGYKIVFAVGEAFGQYVQSARFDRVYLLGVAGGSLISVIYGLTVIPIYGLFGAACTLFVAQLFTLVVNFGVTLYSFYMHNNTLAE